MISFSKYRLIRIVLALGMLLGCAIFFFYMNIISGPGTVCYTNNDFGEYWVEMALLLNAIVWGLVLLHGEVKIYRHRNDKPEPGVEDEEWGV